MGRILCLDYGTRRIGVAVTDTMQIIASGVKTIDKKVTPRVFEEIQKLLDKYEPEELVIGLPISMSGENSKKTDETLFFVEKLKERFEIPIILQDERLTTVESHKILHKMGKKTGKNKAKIDEIAASIILRNYLDEK
ncbi:MAG: Holliday junction resolvase RuvX [Calditrichaeota bacterium]|nr:MAG: Holliday junction resolvase RuvX [Calditrichota bacterium]